MEPTWFDVVAAGVKHLGPAIGVIVLLGFLVFLFVSGFMRKLMFNDDNSFRGSFINMVLTITYGVLIACGAFSDKIAANLNKMETLMIGFYAISFTVWSGKKVLEQKYGMTDVNFPAEPTPPPGPLQPRFEGQP